MQEKGEEMNIVAIAWMLVVIMLNTFGDTAVDGIIFGIGIALAVWTTYKWLAEKL